MQIDQKIKTKKSTLYFIFYSWLYAWALPIYIDIEYLNKDYTEIRLHILCCTFEFVRISHEHSKKLDKILEDYKND